MGPNGVRDSRWMGGRGAHCKLGGGRCMEKWSMCGGDGKRWERHPKVLKIWHSVEAMQVE